jgi:chromate transporter
MAGVTWELGRATVVDPLAAAIAVVALILLFRFKVNSVWLVVGGGAVGLAVRALLGG